VIPKLRAALLALVLAVYGVAALPLPKSIKRADLDKPIARDELLRWTGILAEVGVVLTVEELTDHVFTVGEAAAKFRRFALDPFKRWLQISGTGQDWALFTYPDSRPHRLEVAIKDPDGWETIFAALDLERDWRADRFCYRRIRGVYDGSTEKGGAAYDLLAKRIGAWAFAEFPDATNVRVRFVRTHSVLPGETPDPEETPRHPRLQARPK